MVSCPTPPQFLSICHMLQECDASNSYIGVQTKYEVTGHQQEDWLRITYTWKKVLPTNGGLPCARKLKLAVSVLSGSEDWLVSIG